MKYSKIMLFINISKPKLLKVFNKLLFIKNFIIFTYVNSITLNSLKNLKLFIKFELIKINNLGFSIGKVDNYKYGFIMPFMLHLLHKDIPEETNLLVEFAFNMFIISSIVLYFLLNILGYILSIYVIEKYKLTDKYPKLSKFVNYYINVTTTFLVIEAFICISLLLFIVISNGYICSSVLFK